MKINAKSKLMSSVAMLLVAAIALTSSSFAWFSMSKNVGVNEFTLTATTTTSLQISADGTSWGSSMTSATPTATLAPISSVDALTFFEPNGSTYDTNGLPTSFATTTSGYYDFTVHLRTTGTKNVKVYLNNDLAKNKVDSYVGAIPATADNGFVGSSVRIAFLNAAATAPSMGSSSIIWEPNSTIRMSAYSFSTQTGTWATGTAVATSARDSATTKATQPIFTTLGVGGTQLCTLTGGTTGPGADTTITVRVWIEGEDADNCTQIAGQIFKTMLSFYGDDAV